MTTEMLFDNDDINSFPQIYCGPNIYTLGLRKFTVFAEHLPFGVRQAIAKIPEIQFLIVPYKKLEDMREKISKKGSPEFEYYKRVENSINL